MSQRGNPVLRRADAALGPVLIASVGMLLRIRKLLPSRRSDADTTLLVCFGAIGDLLLLAAVAQRTLPGQRLLVACTPENRGAVTVFPDLFDDVLVVHLRRPWSLSRALRGVRVSRVIDSTQWANVSALQVGFLGLAQPRSHLSGFASASGTRRLVYDDLVPHSSSSHETENFAALLGASDFDPDSLVTGMPATTSTVALHLWPSGTRSHLKEWPLSHWVELAQRLHDRGCTVVVTGGPADRERNDRFIAATGLDVTNLAGELSLKQAHDYFRDEVALCVSVNTGTMHLATLAGTAVVALNGPTNPVRWGPVGPHAVALLPSSGNFGYLNYGFEYPTTDDEAYSLDNLSVDAVSHACFALLPAQPDGATDQVKSPLTE